MIENILHSLRRFHARFARRHQCRSRMSDIYRELLKAEEEQDLSRTPHLRFRSAGSATPANTKSVNDNSRVRRVLTCWE
jgi:hypothetical protein